MNKVRFFGWLAAVLLAACFCVSATAQEYSNGDKIDIVNRIVETKFREGAELSEILSAVTEKIPPGPPDAKLSPDVVRQLKEKARERFPSTQKELETKYAAEAEMRFPVYRPGDTVTVYYRVYGGTFDKLTGKFYRQDPKFVWIGNKKIAKADLQEGYAPRFESERIEQIKNDFIKQNVAHYLSRRNDYENELKKTALHQLKGDIFYEGKWMSLRKLTKKKYQEAKEAKIMREKMMFVEQAIARAKEARTYDEAFEILTSVMHQYPDAENIDQARKMFVAYREKQQKEEEEAEERRRQLARRNSADGGYRTTSSSSGNGGSTMIRCPACKGKGSVTQSGFMPGMVSASVAGVMTTCATCSGSGKILADSKVKRCPYCNGKGSMQDFLSGRPIQCDNCEGSGFVIEHEDFEQ